METPKVAGSFHLIIHKFPTLLDSARAEPLEGKPVLKNATLLTDADVSVTLSILTVAPDFTTGAVLQQSLSGMPQ